jgi:hypothetical protein
MGEDAAYGTFYQDELCMRDAGEGFGHGLLRYSELARHGGLIVEFTIDPSRHTRGVPHSPQRPLVEQGGRFHERDLR